MSQYLGSGMLAAKALLRRAIGSDFVRKIAETLASRILLMGVGLVMGVVIARVLGPEGLGLYALATTISAVGMQFGNLGLHASNTYFAAKDSSLLPSLVGNTLVVSFGFGGLCVALAWFIFSLRPDLAPVRGLLLIVALLWIPFGLAEMLLRNLLLGIQDVRAYNGIEVMSRILTVCLTGLAIVLRIVTVEIILAAGLIALIFSVVWTLRRMRPYLLRISLPSFELFRRCFEYGAKAYLSAFAALVVIRASVFLVNHYLDAEEAGLYGVALGGMAMIELLPVTIGSLFFPRLCAKGDWAEKLRYTKQVSIVMGIVMVTVTTMAVLIAEPVLTAIYGRSYAGSAAAFRWLMPGVFILSIEGFFRRLLISDGYRIEVVYAWLITLIVSMALNVILIPRMGITGAALAWSTSLAVLAVLTILLVQRLVVKPFIVSLPLERGGKPNKQEI
jgi:O-antigen/teichoic acid export membrane protein